MPNESKRPLNVVLRATNIPSRLRQPGQISGTPNAHHIQTPSCHMHGRQNHCDMLVAPPYLFAEPCVIGGWCTKLHRCPPTGEESQSAIGSKELRSQSAMQPSHDVRARYARLHVLAHNLTKYGHG